MELRLDATPEELPIFIAEVDEILQNLDEQLVRLEQDGPSPELLQEVFRAAHTIKGSSAAIGHLRMARLTHAMETLLDKLRKSEMDVSPELVDRLFQGLDMLKVLAAEVESLEQGDLDVDGLVDALEALAHGEAATGRAPDKHGSIRASMLEAPEGSTHHLLVELEAESWGAVRALQVVLAIEQIGELRLSHPSRAEIDQQNVEKRLEAFIESDRSVAEIREVLSEVPEIAILSLADLADDAGTDAPGAPVGAAGAESAVTGDGHETGSEAASAEAGAARGAAAPKRGAARPANTTVRIDVERLDNLLNLVGELVIDRTRLTGLGRALAEQFGEHQLFSDLTETTFRLGRVTDELQSEVMKSRMLPVGTVFSRFPRVVRDLSTKQGKKVELVVEGQETELDRSVIEEIGDPLVHLLRNAVDHGIESPDDRAAAGKPEQATVRLTAEHAENSIVIAVEDDGKGIDAARIRAKAIEKGIVSQEAAARLSDAEAVDLIFAPGFSTAAAVTDVSGRGVGMDIVRTNVERLGGTVEVQTTPGKGSRFLLRLPLTLAIVQALLVKVGGGIYALPLSSVAETLRVPANEVQRLRQQEAILLRGRVLPIARLTAVFGTPPEVGADGKGRDDLLVVAVKVGERQVGLAVNHLLGEQEVVIKALGPLVGDVPGISSAAILGDGAVALIVDVPALIQRLATDRNDWRRSDARDGDDSALARTA